MTDADTTTSAGNRRGRYALSAVILVLTIIGVTAVIRGTQNQPHQPPLAAVGRTARRRSGNRQRLECRPDHRSAYGNSTPTRVVIPALDVDVPLTGLGQQADGTMQVPSDAKTVGWYTKAPTPGSLGPAVLAGHVDYQNKPGTFNRLTDLKPGDTITVDRQDGSMAMFTVVNVKRYAKNKFPTKRRLRSDQPPACD